MQTQTAPARSAPVATASSAARYPARAFGIGYGRSSGYATPRRYTPSTTPPRFRVV